MGFLSFLQRRKWLVLSIPNLIAILFFVGYHSNISINSRDTNTNSQNIKTELQPCLKPAQPPSILENFLNHASYDRSRNYRTRMSFAQGGEAWGRLVSNRLVCLGTQTSLDRLYWLVPILLNWSGPVSLSLFVADLEFPLAVRYWEYLERCEPRVTRQVSMHMTFPVDHPPVDDDGSQVEDDLAEAPCDNPRSVLEDLLSRHLPPDFKSSFREQLLYPQNLLRNLAKSGCQTNYTFVPDIDMIPVPGMDLELERFLKRREEEEKKEKGEGKEDTLRCDKCAYVIPTFEIAKDVPRLPSNKSELVQLVRQNKAREFHKTIYSINQKSSNLGRWLKLPASKDDSDPAGLDVAYKVEKYIFRYEPLYVSRGDTPPFDERFVGFGMTRNTQVYEMYVAGYDFLLLDSAFTSHWGFQSLSSRPEWRATQMMDNNKRFDEFAKELFARYGRDPYDMMSKLKGLNLKNVKVVFSKKKKTTPTTTTK